jgi:hypothetical protein
MRALVDYIIDITMSAGANEMLRFMKRDRYGDAPLFFRSMLLDVTGHNAFAIQELSSLTEGTLST